MFIANPEIISNYKKWINTLSGKDFKKIFPNPGDYNLYLLSRDYSIEPMITEVSEFTPSIIKDGILVKYVVE